MAQSNIVSLMNSLELILRTDRFRLFHVKQQIITLYRKVRFLQKLLQDFPKSSREEEAKSLEIRIRDSAYAIEDVVESRITEQIISDLPKFMANLASVPDLNSVGLDDQSLKEAIEEIDSIAEELLEGSCGLKGLAPMSYLQVGSSRRSGGSKMMVGLDDDALQLKDRLTWHEPKLQAIPIVGMGGIGKTTLANNLYLDPLVKCYFDVRAWVTISQTYTERDVLESLLKGIGALSTREQGVKSIQELTVSLYRNLKGRRYLIVLDDMWSTNVWDDLKMVFPDDGNGSRVMLTTRLVEVAVYSTDSFSPPHQMKLLDEEKSWELLFLEVFGNQDCPSELEDIGKTIARICRGLPLAIKVIGGLLANSSMTRDFWEYVAQNVNSLAVENDEHCHEILSLSYHNLPHHLKTCFLYFGAFPEDHKISVTKLIRLWVGEGFLKPITSKSMECAAEEYLENLIDRNLVFVHRKGSDGKIRRCIIHDLLRELCIKEAQKEDFLYIISGSAPLTEGVSSRRIMHPGTILKDEGDLRATMESMVYVRSLLRTGRVHSALEYYRRFMSLRVLVVLGAIFEAFPFDLLLLVNLRHLAISVRKLSMIPPHISLLWKLQILIIQDYEESASPDVFQIFNQSYCALNMPSEILQLIHLRHLQINKCFLLDPTGCNSSIVLKDMETLSKVANFRCTKEFLKRFPNIKKLGVCYYTANIQEWSDYHLQNLALLSKLENLKCIFNLPPKHYLLPNLDFPQSLRKLTLSRSGLFWRDMTIVGSLPNLQVLKLKEYAFVGKHWEPIEGEFCRLKFLLIDLLDLEEWMAEDTHFPRLEHLIFQHCYSLRGIPSSVGDIATLRMIEIDDCTPSAAASAEQILEEQRSMENHVLQFRVSGLVDKLRTNLQKAVDSF